MADPLPRRLEELLGHWPGPVEHTQQIDSTNTGLMARARAGAPEWSVLLADEQSAGRGRRGREWCSPGGGLYVSVLLRGDALVRPTLIPLVSGLAIAVALERHGVAVRLKWPNDVMLEGLKLAGILAEGIVGRAGLEGIVVGLGVNIDLQSDVLPADLNLAASSVRLDRFALAADWLRVLRAECRRLAEGGAEIALAEWKGRSIDWWGHRVRVDAAAERVEGRAQDIGPDGELILVLDDGTARYVRAGEARELRRLEPAAS